MLLSVVLSAGHLASLAFLNAHSQQRPAPLERKQHAQRPHFQGSAFGQRQGQARPLLLKKSTWTFVKYVPSAFERSWAAGIGRWKQDICKHLNEQTQKTKPWLDAVRSNMRQPSSSPPDAQIFSKHVYKSSDGMTKELVRFFPQLSCNQTPRSCDLHAPSVS